MVVDEVAFELVGVVFLGLFKYCVIIVLGLVGICGNGRWIVDGDRLLLTGWNEQDTGGETEDEDDEDEEVEEDDDEDEVDDVDEDVVISCVGCITVFCVCPSCSSCSLVSW